MPCIEPEKLGRYFDGELPERERAELESHLEECQSCRSELAVLASLRDEITLAETADPPAELWENITQSLAAAAPASAAGLPRRFRGLSVYRRLGAAAGIAAAVGIVGFAAFWIGRGSPVQAAAVDFGVLLDSISDGALEAFDRFVSHHGGQPVDPGDAHRSAPNLDFEIPAVLPGGYQRGRAYLLSFGGSPGIAAAYTRSDGEFLATIFHPPVKKEDFGTHQDYPCVIGEHRGHSVEVGEWRMVHLTDPTTCHCVLSRISDDHALASIMTAVAPRSSPSGGHGH